MTVSFDNLRSVRDIAQRNPALGENSLRWMIFNAKDNGLAPVLVRIGRRVFLDEPKFSAWIADQQRCSHAAK